MIYFDNSATTIPTKEVIDEVGRSLTEDFGNPSSLHSAGIKSEQKIESVRSKIAEKLKCKSNEIYFTSGGTEGNNLCILGTAKVRSRFGKKIVTSTVEHPSVLKCMDKLEKDGFRIIRLTPENDGTVSAQQLEKNVDSDTILVSLMQVNNEIGTLNNITELSHTIKRKNSNTIFHTDIVQGFCKIPLDLKRIPIDMATISGHKIHAPKGIGAVIIRNGLKIEPLLYGGGQEKNLRSGTENTAAICGFGKAVEIAGNITSDYQKMSELNDYLRKRISETPSIKVNSPNNASPYLISINFAETGLQSEQMINFLNLHDVLVSGGSACAKGRRSYVLQSLGYPADIIDSTLRLSFSRYTTKDEINHFMELVAIAEKNLRKKR